MRFLAQSTSLRPSYTSAAEIQLADRALLKRGTPGDESQDYGYNFTNVRRRSNSSSHGHAIGDFKTKFEHIDADPVFEEEFHGAPKEDSDMSELSHQKSESADSVSLASVEEEDASKK